MEWVYQILVSVVATLLAFVGFISAIFPDTGRLGQDSSPTLVVVPADTLVVQERTFEEASSSEAYDLEVPQGSAPAPELAELPGEVQQPSGRERVTASVPLSLPVVSTTPVREALYSDGIYGYTNAERYRSGMALLKRNATLDRIAAAKADDMFARQYFAHKSPSGEDVGGLAKRYGYQYITVGENLASGAFRDNAEVVSAWMNSPGHKANILNKSFAEIGIAARKGTFKGHDIWIAVQTFGVSRTMCSEPESALLATIETEKNHLAKERQALTNAEEALSVDNLKKDAYERQYASYVSIVESYNIRVKALKEKVDLYNNGVRTFNACITRYMGSSKDPS